MNDDLTLLLQAICENPADNTARLVYADAVQEAGDDDRAEFIRAQVELSRVPSPDYKTIRSLWPGDTADYEAGICVGCDKSRPNRCPWHTLYRRGRGLFDVELGYRLRDAHDFLRHTVEPDTYHGRTDNCCLYTRGFVSHLTTTAELFLAHEAALLWHPSQKLNCVDCRGRGYNRKTDVYINGVWQYNDEHVDQCESCNRQGSVPRPFPATAQPITDITLTTTPAFFHEMTAEAGTWRHSRWPGVRFTLATIGTVTSVTNLVPHTFAGMIRVSDELLTDAGVEPFPREMAVPSDGWFLDADRRDREIEYHGRMYSMIGETTFTLTIRFTPPEGHFTPPAPGTTLRDLTATDRSGRRYRVPSAILTRVNQHMARYAPGDVELTATASGTPEALATQAG